MNMSHSTLRRIIVALAMCCLAGALRADPADPAEDAGASAQAPAVAGLCLRCAVTADCGSEVSLRLAAAEITVTANGATLRQIFDCLAPRTGLRVDWPNDGSGDKTVQGVYTGSIEKIIRRLLQDLNYVEFPKQVDGVNRSRIVIFTHAAPEPPKPPGGGNGQPAEPKGPDAPGAGPDGAQ